MLLQSQGGYKMNSDKGSYMYQDGRPDDMEGCLLANRCFVRVLSKVLQENEGVVVKLPYQEEYSDDPYGKFIVYRRNGLILVSECGVDEQKFEDGQWLWFHDMNETLNKEPI